jgi:hypothetical protein
VKERSSWYNSIVKQINQLKDTLTDKGYRKYKLCLLLCVTGRVTEFSPQCSDCQTFQLDILKLVKEIGNMSQVSDKDKSRSYFKSINRIISHLQKQHKLVNEGQYI